MGGLSWLLSTALCRGGAHVDFEPPDAAFDGETYSEGGVEFFHEDVSNLTDASWGLTTTSATGTQGMFLTMLADPSAVEDPDHKARQEWGFGTYELGRETWYSFQLRFGADHEVTAWYPTILSQIRYSGSGHGFEAALALDEGTDPSTDIPLSVRYMEGNTADSAAYDSLYIDTGVRFERERWYHVMVHFLFDPDGGGWYHVYVDGVRVMALDDIAAGVRDGYIRLGQYGRLERTHREVFFDDFRQGDTRAEVEPAAAVPAVPVLTPRGGTYLGAVDVGVSASNAVRYTLDGSDPTESSAEADPILHLEASAVLAARAYGDGGASEVVKGSYVVLDVPLGVGELAVAGAVASADDGNVALNVLDNDLGTRWSASGDGQWIELDLGTPAEVHLLTLAQFAGDERSWSFDLSISEDGTSWVTPLARASTSGTSALEEVWVLPAPTVARFIRLLGHENSLNHWNSLTEVSVWGAALEGAPDDTGDTGTGDLEDTGRDSDAPDTGDGAGAPDEPGGAPSSDEEVGAQLGCDAMAGSRLSFVGAAFTLCVLCTRRTTSYNRVGYPRG